MLKQGSDFLFEIFSLRLFEITEVETTRVDCTLITVKEILKLGHLNDIYNINNHNCPKTGILRFYNAVVNSCLKVPSTQRSYRHRTWVKSIIRQTIEARARTCDVDCSLALHPLNFSS